MSDVILVTSERLNLFLIKSSSFSDVFASLCIFMENMGNMEDFSGFVSEFGSVFVFFFRLHVRKGCAQQLGGAE